MSLSLANLREDLRAHLGMDDDDLPDVNADRLLNRAWWPMAAQLRFNEKDAEYTFTTVAEQNNYSFPSDNDAVQRIVIKDVSSSQWVPLNKFDDANIIAEENDQDSDIPHSYSRRGDKFILFPTPDDKYEVRVKYFKTLDDIQSSGPGVPQEWHEVILWGAVARGFFIRGDFVRGNAAESQQAKYLSVLQTQEERETVDRTYSGMKAIRRRYP